MSVNTRRIPYNGGKIYRKLTVRTNKKEATKDANDLRKQGILVRIFERKRNGIDVYELWTHGLTF